MKKYHPKLFCLTCSCGVQHPNYLSQLLFFLSQNFSDGRSLGHVFRPISAYWATGSFDTRIVQNTAAINIWSENFLFGVGQTKIQDELMIEYQNENYRFGLKRKSNVHNQILFPTKLSNVKRYGAQLELMYFFDKTEARCFLTSLLKHISKPEP